MTVSTRRTIRQVALEIGADPRAIRWLVTGAKIPVEVIGGSYTIATEDVPKVRDHYREHQSQNRQGRVAVG